MGLHFRLEFEDGAAEELMGPGFTVTEVELWQAMSELYHLTVRFRSPAPEVELRQLLGQRVVAHFLRGKVGDEPERHLPRVAGIVRRSRQLVAREPGALSTYELVIAPVLSLLDLHRGSYIQQRVTAPELVGRHFDFHNGVSSRKLDPAVDATHAPRRREYVVQYGERNLDHLRRILAEDGIAFYFAGDALRDVKLVSDTTEDRASAQAIRLPYRPASDALQNDDDVVLELETGPELRPTLELVRDYHFDNPQFRAQGGAAVPPVAGEESRDYVYEEGALHEFDAGGKVDRLMEEAARTGVAERRLQAERRSHAVVTCRTSCPLPVGAVLTVTGEHPMADTELTIVASTTVQRYAEDAAGGHVTRFHRATCIPASFPFRPPRLPKPRIFEDANGREELHVEAERLYTRKVKGSESTAVGGSRSLVVGSDQSVRIEGDFVTHVGGAIHTKSADNYLVSDGFALVACATRTEDTTGTHSMRAGTMRIQVDGALAAEAGSVTIEAGTITLKAGGSSIEITDGAITIKAGSVSIN